MISIILYGRNDSYGYNLHKRAALSLNCMAEVLTAPGDEIIFVDYNTPDDFPTFPEAIRDTLTRRAQGMLRILRVRPAQHARFQDRTHLKALEPISRNVALRRSNPNNRWILSTNTDMIFVPRRVRSLSGVAADLEGGFYHLPRFEIPEYLWETLDRLDPVGVIAEVGRWGWSLHLNEVVTGLPTNRYDGPGDFQLGLRKDLFDIRGFDERMLIGWHVDSNLAWRMSLLYGRPETLVDDMFGYHCDHTRQATPAHSHNRVQNDWNIYVYGVTRADIPSQADDWGLAGEDVEEVHLGTGTRLYLHALHKAVGEPMREMSNVAFLGSNYDRLGYDSRHVLPFLLDAFTAYPRGVTVAWFGARSDLLSRFAVAWQAMGQTGPILLSARADWLPNDLPGCCRRDTGADLIAAADILVFDFGLSALPADDEEAADRTDASRALRMVELALRAAISAERQRLAKQLTPRRLIAVNAINNRFGELIDRNVAITLAPFATRLRQGFVLPSVTESDLLPILYPGENVGEKLGSGAIAGRVGQSGIMLHGIYRALDAGWYRVSLAIGCGSAAQTDDAACPLRMEIMGGEYYLATKIPTVEELRRGTITCLFQMPALPGLLAVLQPVQLRIISDGSYAIEVTAGRLEKVDDTATQEFGTIEPLRPEVTWLPILNGVRRATTDTDGLHIALGDRRWVVFGPYYPLLPGRYEAAFSIVVDDGPSAPGFVADVFATTPDVTLAQADSAPNSGPQKLVLPFEISGDSYGLGQPRLIQFRLFSHGQRSGTLVAITTRRLDDPEPHPAILNAMDF